MNHPPLSRVGAFTSKLDYGILGVDPGSKRTAVIVYSPRGRKVHRPAKLPNEEIKDYFVDTLLANPPIKIAYIVFELISCYGMAVGKTVFDTVRWNGRFIENAVNVAEERDNTPGALPIGVYGVPRIYVKSSLLPDITPRARNDSTISSRIKKGIYAGREIDPLALQKGRPAVGPLAGVKADIWQALAVACAFAQEGARWEKAYTYIPAGPLYRN